jgi:hypothetical protein
MNTDSKEKSLIWVIPFQPFLVTLHFPGGKYERKIENKWRQNIPLL